VIAEILSQIDSETIIYRLKQELLIWQLRL
jgi:hypothetical protein